MKRRFILSLFLIAIVLILGACNYPAVSSPQPQDNNALMTQAVLTVLAQSTQLPGLETATLVQGTVVIGQQTQTGQPPLTVFPSATEPSGAQPTQVATNTLPPATNTSVPPSATWTNTPIPPTNTPVPPTNTPVPTATAIPIPCNAAKFVKDINYPDGSVLAPGAPFIKTWRIRNVGSCAWSAGYLLAFVRGDQMGGIDTPLPKVVYPGEAVDVSAALMAPMQSGHYRGYWMLRSGAGRFGIGADADSPFWVDIRVGQPSGIVYNFADNYCSAMWRSSIGPLICPGRSSDPMGFVLRLNNPDLESRSEDEPALWTNPEIVNNGWIAGIFPPFNVTAKDSFIATVGCLAGNKNCDVIFQLYYATDGVTWIKLGEWREVYDGNTTRAQVNLSPLAGKLVQFELVVNTNGAYNQDAAFWLMPQINRAP